MKKTHRSLIFPSIFIIPVIMIIVFMDLAGAFSHGDIPFVMSGVLYVIFVIVQRVKSRVSFMIALLFLILLALSYMPTGAGMITERIGEWFYVFFAFGLIQYIKEVLNFSLQ